MRRLPNDDPFSARVLRWVVGVSVVSFAAALVMGAFGEDLVEPSSAGPSSFSWSALGHRAAAELLEKDGIRVLVRQDPRGARGGAKTAVFFLEPELEKMREQGSVLETLVTDAHEAGAAVVLVAPKWEPGVTNGRDPPWIASADEKPLHEVEAVIAAMGEGTWVPRRAITRGAVDACEAPFGDVVVDVVSPAQMLSPLPSAWEPVVECEGGTLIAAHRASRTVLVADPDLFANHGLARGDHAEILLDLVKEELGADTVIFDEAVHGFRRRMTLLAELARPPLVVATLHGTFVLGLVLWAGMGRFGKPRDAAPALGTGKQALIENTALLLKHGGHTGDSLARYFRDTLRAVAAHHQIPAEVAPAELLARLQAISDAKKLGLRLAQTQAMVSRAGVADDRAVRLAQTIHRWRMEMTSK